MKRFQLGVYPFAIALLTFAGACAAAGSDGASGHRVRGGSAGSNAVEIPGAQPAMTATDCEIGTHACICPDGQPSGMQYCDSRRELSACGCAVSASSASAGDTMTDPTNICAELADAESCSAKSYKSQEVEASILFVVDRSGSMACNAPPTQTVEDCNNNPRRAVEDQPSRWETTIAALDVAFADLMGRNAAVGLSLFSSDGACGADSAPQVGLSPIDATQVVSLSDALDQAMPAGGTPIVGSTILAYKHLHQELHAGGNRFVVLITDGEESCGAGGDEDDKGDLAAARKLLLDTEVQKARDANVRTFVIGAPGSEGARGFLSELAFRGGTARKVDCVHGDSEGTVGDCHYDLTTDADFAAVLGEALGMISGQAIGCEFRTPPGADAKRLNVQFSTPGVTPVCFGHDDAPCEAGANGWQFKKRMDGSEDVGSVVLCGAACDQVKANPDTTVDVILGCLSVM